MFNANETVTVTHRETKPWVYRRCKIITPISDDKNFKQFTIATSDSCYISFDNLATITPLPLPLPLLSHLSLFKTLPTIQIHLRLLVPFHFFPHWELKGKMWWMDSHQYLYQIYYTVYASKRDLFVAKDCQNKEETYLPTQKQEEETCLWPYYHQTALRDQPTYIAISENVTVSVVRYRIVSADTYVIKVSEIWNTICNDRYDTCRYPRNEYVLTNINHYCNNNDQTSAQGITKNNNNSDA